MATRLYPFYAVGFRTFATKRAAQNYAKKHGDKVYTVNSGADRERVRNRMIRESYIRNPSSRVYAKRVSAVVSFAKKLGVKIRRSK